MSPLIAYASPRLETLAGRDVTLSCVVLLGNPPPAVTWYKMGEPLSTNQSGAHLQLRDVGVADDGEYTCVASNAGGNATQSVQLDVHGQYAYTHTHTHTGTTTRTYTQTHRHQDVDIHTQTSRCGYAQQTHRHQDVDIHTDV